MLIGLAISQMQRTDSFAHNKKLDAANQGKNMESTFVTPVHTNFDLAFTDGHKFKGNDDAVVSVSVVKVGNLDVPSGKIMACDPGTLSPHDAKSFTFEQVVPKGQHPVFISMATVGPEHKRVAAAKVQFSNEKVTRWEMALRAGQRIQDLKQNEMSGYGVDCGTGCFADPSIFNGLRDNEYDEKTTDKLFQDMDEHGGDWGSLSLPKGNLIAVHSGWGDGFYASYFGLDSSGRPVCLVTDFEVLVTTLEGHIVLNDLPSHYSKKVDSLELKKTKTEIWITPVSGKPNTVLLEITGDGASSVDIEHKKTKGIKKSTLTYSDHGKNIEIEFAIDPSVVELALSFSKGTQAFE